MPRDIGQKWNPTVKQPSSFNTEISTDIPQTHLSNLGTTNDHDHHDSFRDVLSTEPVLSGDNPGVKKSESNNGTDEDDQDTTDSTSTTANFAGYDRDEGAGNYSSDSDRLSTGLHDMEGS